MNHGTTDTPDIAELRREFEANRPEHYCTRDQHGDYAHPTEDAAWQAALWAHRRALATRDKEVADLVFAMEQLLTPCGTQDEWDYAVGRAEELIAQHSPKEATDGRSS